MISVFLLVVLHLILTPTITAQAPNFELYSTVGRFSCEDVRALERIVLNQQCGLIISPCYPDNYPEEVTNGFKIWDINATDGSNAPVVAYRFTLNDFVTDEFGGFLDFAVDVTYDPITNINSIDRRQRIISLSGNAGEDPGLFVRMGRSVTNRLLTGEYLDLNQTRLYLTFYAARAFAQRGFNITYCADYDKCNSNYSPPICDPIGASQCVRIGFNNYTCICASGFTGERCEIDINECLQDRCPAENATCQNTVGSFRCRCNEGYTGDGTTTCTDIDECNEGLDNCASEEEATCVNTQGSHRCFCNEGYSGDGRTCMNIDECSVSSPCDSNAECTDTPGSFTCTCRNGYRGNGILCVDVDECSENIGNCDDANRAMCTNTDGSFICSCLPGFTGDGRNCSNLNECSMENDCDSNARCIDTEGSFNCICQNGFNGNGTSCADIDECAENTADCAGNNTSSCTNNDGSYSCSCNEGYSGDGRMCININECDTENPCDSNAFCRDTPGSVTCTCNSGFSGNGFTCTDINECLQDSCAENATCQNTVGSFRCRCNEGYTGDGTSTCTDIDECNESLDNCTSEEEATCVNTQGSYRCFCNEGYSGDGRTCMNIDECSVSSPCDSNAECNDTSGSFTCTCRNGYRGNGILCVDVDECSENIGNCDDANRAMCTNTDGSFICSCLPGFTGDGTNCSNLNECSMENDCDSNARCVDTEGSFNCICQNGFNGNGTSCADIDECAENTADCAGNNSSSCTNNNGSYSCSCNEGYSGDGRMCININECVTENPCDSNAFCRDIPGSLTCTCNFGFSGDGFNCTDIDECGQGIHNCAPNGTAICNNTEGSYTCRCNEGYSGNGRMCNNVNECMLGLCHTNADCEDTAGSFTCSCMSGYQGDGDFCVDIDECMEETNNCAPNNTSDCRNTEGSFVCSCSEGYTGDGATCNNLNECEASPCDSNASCMDVDGSFMCACNEGYTGNGFECADVNECIEMLDNCPRSRANCRNTEGSFMCSCIIGYTGDGVNCTNINECLDNPCDDNATCIDLMGHYDCQCHEGYSGNGLFCRNINECELSPCDDNASCEDTPGSFNCRCDEGYTGDGFECSDMNECTSVPRVCAPNNTATCVNTDGSYTCSCNEGYSGDGRICRDIDECSLNLCDENARCLDLDGSFSCECRDGFTGDGNTCSNIDECAISNPCHFNAECNDTIGSYTCTCVTGFTGDGNTNCTDINECDLVECDENAICTNTDGSFTCTCRSGFTGNGLICQDVNECETGENNCSRDVLEERCMNTPGSFECSCNTPSYRGTPPNCLGYFCPGEVHLPSQSRASDCVTPGIIEWPNFYDGNQTYNRLETVSWFVNFSARRNTSAIRFRFIQLSVESPQDYIIFSEQASLVDQPWLAVISGNMSDVFNLKYRANSTNPIGYDDAAKTYTLVNRTMVYVHFYSDRQNVSTGFQIQYEPVQDVDDCPSVNPCVNGGVCEDGLFTYYCRGCSIGYTGQNCSEDIDECSENLHDCDVYADCINTEGGYTCVCRDTFAGNGSFCNPLIILSDLEVTSVNNETTSFLVVNFNVSKPWGRNTSFVINYQVGLTYQNNGDERMLIAVDSTNLDNQLPLRIPVIPAVIYSISVTNGDTGDLFVEADYREERNTGVHVISNSIRPLPPTTLRVVSSDEVLVNVSWTRPDDQSTGPISAFELGYRRNESECEIYEVLGPQVDCGNETLIRVVPDNNFYVITGLQLYRTYQIRLRALTNGGPSEWTEYVVAFTGTVCRHQSSRSRAIASPCTSRSASMSSSNFPGRYMGFERRYWQIDFSGQGAIRIVFDYFNIEMNQDFLDIGEGSFPEGRLITNRSSVSTYTGNLTGQARDLVFQENEINNGTVFVRFNSDLFTFTRSRGFQIHYETNASRCNPNPCVNGRCMDGDFDFQCQCRPRWTGKTCDAPLVNISAFCNESTSDSFVFTWSVTPEWSDEIAAIPEYLISYEGITVRLATGTFNYRVTGLDPNQLVNVSVTVNPIHPGIPSSQTTIACRTEEGIPNPPQYVNATAVSSDTIEVSWAPSDTPNGEILAYNVTYEQTDAAVYNEDSRLIQTLVSERTLSVNELRAYRNYTITVSVINIVGEGPRSYTVETTLPTAPAGPVLNVTANPGARSVMLVITPPTLVTGPFTYDLMLMFENGSQLSFTDAPSPYTFGNLIPYTFYNATIYPRSGGIRGRAPFFFNFTTREDTPGPISNLLPNQITTDSLQLSWNPPAEPNGVITGYRVEWTISGSNRSSPLLPSNTTTFFISGLMPFTEYSFSVFAYTSVGRGLKPGSLLARTAAGVPSVVRNLRAIVNKNNSITITFDQPAETNGELVDYDLQIAQNQTECEMFNDPTDRCFTLQHTIPSCTRASLTTMVLPSYRYFTITAAARTCAGTGPPSYVRVQTFPTDSEDIIEDIRLRTTDPTEVSVEFYAPIPITGPTNYVITATSRLGNISTQTLENSTSLHHSINFTGLNPAVSYLILIARNTSSGLVNASVPVMLQRVPSLRDGAGVLPYTGEQDLEGASPTHAFLVENPCNRKGEIFSEEEGPVESIDLVVKEVRANADQDIGVWSNSVTQSPVPPFVTDTLDCRTSRKRRQVNSNGDGYIVGFDTSCNRNGDGVCNGPLASGRSYQVAYRANNQGGTSELTPYGGDTFVAKAPEERSSSLHPATVAAIVATVTLVLLLLLFLVVYLVNRRLQSQGSYAASKKEDKTQTNEENGATFSAQATNSDAANETNEDNNESVDDVMKSGKETAV